jgi:tryptophan-rich sensory protein
MSEASTSRGKTVLIAFAAALGVAIVGGLMSDIGPWYDSLIKPDWQPPNSLFAPVWTLIYALTAAAGALAWWNSPDRDSKLNVLIWFSFNALFNVLWSLLFFRMHRPDWALTEIALLWVSIVVLIYVCFSRSKLAVLLLLPYLAWVTFAAFLNAEIYRLNGPF